VFARRCARATAAALRGWGVPDERVTLLELAVSELATNVARHGYGDGGGPLELDLLWGADGLALTLRDEGVPFDPADGPTPPEPRPDDPVTWPEGGMGLALVRAAADELRYRREHGRNVITLLTRDPLAAVPAP